MNFHTFRRHFSRKRYFTTEEVRLLDPDFRLPSLTDWQSQGLIENHARGVWGFTDMGTPITEESLAVLAYFVNPHSYVSLEYAFRLYNLIPEEVYSITCVTTTKTQKIETPHGRVSYQKIPSRAYFGYTTEEHEGQHYQRAVIEKAILDYLWLHKDVMDEVDFEELRWNPFILRTCDLKRLGAWAQVYGTKPFLTRVQNLISYIQSL